MYVTVHVYRARAGEEDAIVALHEDWQRRLRARAGGYLSRELLHDIHDPRRFVAIAYYESEAVALAAAHDPEHAAWQRRLNSLAEEDPLCTSYYQVWHSGSKEGTR